MSKLKSDNINYNDDFIVVESDVIEKEKTSGIFNEKKNVKKKENQENTKKAESIVNDALQKAGETVKQAEIEAKSILDNAKKLTEKDREDIILKAQNEANNILNSASEQAKTIIEEANKQSKELLDKSKDEIEKARSDAANEGYKDGYQDAGQKIQEELEEKLLSFENFCKIQFEIKDKIIKSASKDILDIIINISDKILHKKTDADAIDKIIKTTISLFEKKQNINIILSEKYARLLYELQKKSLNEEIPFNFEDFKQYEGFEIIYNSKFDDDTIILENPKERYDASISAQMDVIVRDILENTKNGHLDSLNEYIEEEKNEA